MNAVYRQDDHNEAEAEAEAKAKDRLPLLASPGFFPSLPLLFLPQRDACPNSNE